MAEKNRPRLRRLLRLPVNRGPHLWRPNDRHATWGRRAPIVLPPGPPEHPARVVFAISDTGGGHRSAAVAIDAAFKELAPDSVTATQDLLTVTGFPLIANAPQLYNHLSTKRWLPVYDGMWQLTDSRWRVQMLARLVYTGAHRRLLRELMQVQPHLIVSAHPMLNQLLCTLRRAYRLPMRIVTVVTDLVTLHAAWFAPMVDLCLVPTDEAYQTARKRGMPAEKLLRTGFPVHPKFTHYVLSQAESRRALGVAEHAFTLLLTTGGVGAGSLEQIVIELRRRLPDHQLLVVTGKNQQLRRRLESLQLGPLIHIYGFVNNMEQLMAAADVVVTKAGPGTLMETLVMRRPALVTEAVGTQEQGNIDFVLNHELGAYTPTVDRIIAALNDLRDPAVYAGTQARLTGVVPRDGSAQIARLLYEQAMRAGEQPPRTRRRLGMPRIRQWGRARRT